LAGQDVELSGPELQSLASLDRSSQAKRIAPTLLISLPKALPLRFGMAIERLEHRVVGVPSENGI